MDPDSTPSKQKIKESLLEAFNKGKLANAIICFEEPQALEKPDPDVENLECPDREGEEVQTMQEEATTLLEDSMAAVIDILESQKGRLPFTWKMMYENNQILVNGADLKLIEDIAAVEQVAYVDGDEGKGTKKPKIWKKFKSVWKSKK